jgi:hypothetical protein
MTDSRQAVGRFGVRAASLAAILAGTVGVARAETPPYPPSRVVTGITWHTDTYRFGDVGGDIWSVTSAADGTVYTAWGDAATGGCTTKASYGVGAVVGGPGTNVAATGCGPAGLNHGKLGSLLDVGGTLYAVVNTQSRPWPYPDFQVWRSDDHGATWLKPAWSFRGTAQTIRPNSFVNAAPGDAGNDGFAYLMGVRVVQHPYRVFLMRAPVGKLLDQTAYAYFTGLDAQGAPAWGGNPAAARPVFVDRNGAEGARAVWDAGLGRYLLTVAHSTGGRIGVFEGPHTWGPWGTFDYEDRWLGMSGGDFLGVRFPTDWMADAGTTLWTVFSCYGRMPCGIYHDRMNLIEATLTLTPAETARRQRARSAAAGP